MIDYLELLLQPEDEEQEQNAATFVLGRELEKARTAAEALRRNGAAQKTDGSGTLERPPTQKQGWVALRIDRLRATLGAGLGRFVGNSGGKETAKTDWDATPAQAKRSPDTVNVERERTGDSAASDSGAAEADDTAEATGSALPAGGWRTSAGVLKARGRVGAAGVTLEAMGAGGGQGAAALYRQVRMFSAAAGYVRRDLSIQPVTIPSGEWAAGITSNGLDRLYEQDARRYDGAFELY